MPHYVPSGLNIVSLPEFQDWTDENGMMTDNNQGWSTGNGMLFMAHYAFGLHANGILTEEEKARILQVYKNCQRLPGLYNRLPGADGWYQAHDDLVGLMGAESLIRPDRRDRVLTKEILDYGRNTPINGIDPTEPDPKKIKMMKWMYPTLKALSYLNPFSWGKIRYVWNNVNPGTFQPSSWLGRRMEVIATMQMAAGRFVNPIYWLYWAVTMLTLLSPKRDIRRQDAYTLRFHSALACDGYGPITSWICKRVRKEVVKDYGGFGQMLAMYFNKPEHPIAALAANKY
jgi:hypothetical protein